MSSQRNIAWTLNSLARVSLNMNYRPQAQRLLAESLALFLDLGDKEGIAGCVVPLAGMQVEGQPEQAARLLGTLDALVAALEERPPSVAPVQIPAEYDRTVAAVRARLGEAAFAEAWTEGRTLGLEATVADLLVELGE
jgi:hypothetical protein